MGMYIDLYRPWPGWVVAGNEEIANKFGAQIGTYRGHADRDPGHDMTGDLAADFFPYDNTKAKHDAMLAWFKDNAVRIGATYIITWRRIWSVARAAEGVRVYSGSDPHTGHIHVSYGTTPPEEDMPTVKDIWVGTEADVIPSPDNSTKWQSGNYLRNIYNRIDFQTSEIDRKLAAQDEKLAAQDAKLDAILAVVVRLETPPAP
jgi:hypothetical protein